MLYAYVGSAIVGLMLLGASFLGAGHDHTMGHDGTGDGEGQPMLALLSVRVWTYLLAFGGATGLLLRLVGREGEPASAVGAVLVGTAAAWMARIVIGRASRLGASGTVHAQDLVGRTGEVMIPFAAGATGKVRVRIAGADVDVLATIDEGESVGRSDEVLILEVREGGTALVMRSPPR